MMDQAVRRAYALRCRCPGAVGGAHDPVRKDRHAPCDRLGRRAFVMLRNRVVDALRIARGKEIIGLGFGGGDDLLRALRYALRDWRRDCSMRKAIIQMLRARTATIKRRCRCRAALGVVAGWLAVQGLARATVAWSASASETVHRRKIDAKAASDGTAWPRRFGRGLILRVGFHDAHASLPSTVPKIAQVRRSHHHRCRHPPALAKWTS